MIDDASFDPAETGGCTDPSDPPAIADAPVARGNSILSRLYQTYFDTLVKGLIHAYDSRPPDPHHVAHEAFAKLSARGNLEELKNPEGFAWICPRNIVIAYKRSEAVHDAARSEVGLLSGLERGVRQSSYLSSFLKRPLNAAW
ncbi:MAG: hypothetical protein AAGH57_07520 [Pseudomonadota bacterium]